MTNHQRALLKFLQNPKTSDFNLLTVEELALLYVDLCYFETCAQFLVEQHWLQQKNSKPELNFEKFVATFFKDELSQMVFLHAFLNLSSLSEIKKLVGQIKPIEMKIIALVLEQDSAQQKIFATEVLHKISDLFEFENQLQQVKKKQGQHMGLSLYRTYDGLDEIFDLDYKADHGMKTDLTIKERLYEGAGVGVQSGYSTMLTALRYLNPSLNTRVIDLGSGYGRLGFVIGLMRPDIQFTGYEFVPHRVNMAEVTAKKFDLQKNTHFYTQDLSALDFKIPDAEIYYMYDPFSEDTYKYVLNQLIEVSHRQKISIATKGNARFWLNEVASAQGWAKPQEFDNSNLCLYQSE